MIFLIILAIVVLSGISVIFLRRKNSSNKVAIYIGAIIFVGANFLIPLFDPLKMPGFLASLIMGESIPSIYGFAVGLIVINIGIYGIHIFLSSFNLIKKKKYNYLIFQGTYSKMRFPIFLAYHIIGLSYALLMGTITGIIIISVMMMFIYFEALRIENEELIPDFGDAYLEYQKKVPKKIYSKGVLLLLIFEYCLFLIGLFFAPPQF
jgi:protein-S-isoprenylcysteine O-methyltransferase Ste14